VDVAELIDKGERADVPKGEPKATAPAGGDNERYAGPWTLTATASVTEEGGRAVSATRRLEVDRAPYYLGVRRPGRLVRPDTPCAFEITLVAPSGKLAAVDGASVSATLYRQSWNNSLVHDDGHYRYETTRLLEPVGGDTAAGAANVLIAAGRGTFTATCPAGGSYVLRVRDETTGVVTSVPFYAGHGAWEDDVSRENPEQLEVVLLPPGGPEAVLGALGQLDFAGAAALAAGALQPAPEKPEDGSSKSVTGRACSCGARSRAGCC
jgi:uncharacterized protein YfaS (alpha-2-macroglobulin family)